MTDAFPYRDDAFHCHLNNIKQKQRTARGQDAAMMEVVVRTYADYVRKSANLDGDLSGAVAALDTYYLFAKTLEKSAKFFNWRSDFAGSIIPEFLYRLLAARLKLLGVPAEFATRNAVVELTLSNGLQGGWNIRRKNQDLCVGLRREKIVVDNREEEFLVPVLACEIKTNIDKNKINGLNYSAECLKRTFPGARYILATETIDFSLDDNYASGSIDEIYVLRKQVRKDARINRGALCPDVFELFVTDSCELLKRIATHRGHVYDRLASGKLIHG